MADEILGVTSARGVNVYFTAPGTLPGAYGVTIPVGGSDKDTLGYFQINVYIEGGGSCARNAAVLFHEWGHVRGLVGLDPVPGGGPSTGPTCTGGDPGEESDPCKHVVEALATLQFMQNSTISIDEICYPRYPCDYIIAGLLWCQYFTDKCPTPLSGPGCNDFIPACCL